MAGPGVRIGPRRAGGPVITIILISIIGIFLYIGPHLDQVLIRIPLIGYFYEKYLRTITYYRVDQQCMYQEAVHESVMQVLDELVKVQGIQPMSEFERRPVFRDLLQGQGSNGHR